MSKICNRTIVKFVALHHSILIRLEKLFNAIWLKLSNNPMNHFIINLEGAHKI